MNHSQNDTLKFKIENDTVLE